MRPRIQSDCCLVLVSGAYPDDAVDRRYPHLAVADATGLRGLHDDPRDVLDVPVVDEDLDADLRDQGDVVLRTAVDLGVALLPAVAADLADGHAGDAERLQRLADVLPLVGLENGGDELHAGAPWVVSDAVGVADRASAAATGETLPAPNPPCRS